VQAETEQLAEFVRRHPRLIVLTGAGVSTDSGIPDYRDFQGQWKRRQPVRFQEFIGRESTRQRYWARSMLGWPTIANALPGAAHTALAQLQSQGYISALVTQNVDGLHQAAGVGDTLDLHGRIDRCVCLACRHISPRSELQQRLEQCNPAWSDLYAGIAPDGDADLDAADFSDFCVPVCGHCGGMLKPDVVFFGEAVPKDCVAQVIEKILAADAMLVVGSSLMVFSGFRFARMAAQDNRPLAILNQGSTRADNLASLKLELPCGPMLQNLTRDLAGAMA